MHDILTPDSTAEWVELYNPSSCTPVDISCWILGSDESNVITGSNYGAFVFPSGTVIPPLGFIVVGGAFASPKDFDVENSSGYCGLYRWFLTNTDGWVALYDKTGAIINAVYWSSSGAGSLNATSTYNNALNTSFSPTCTCSGTTINTTLAKNMPGIEFIGTSSGGLGQGWKRIVDGSPTWATETPGQSTPKACNGACALPLAASIAGTNPGCSGTGSATVTATNGVTPYTYSWNSGQTSASVSGLAAGNYTCTVTDGCNCTKTVTVTINPASLPFSVSITPANVLCFGGATGSATATVTGNTGPFTYNWNTNPAQTTATATGLQAGTYSVLVTAGGCTASQTVTITQPTQLVVGTSSTPSACGGNNGSVTANPSGGISPYSYTWTPGNSNNATVNNLPAGNYTVNVKDANGCLQTASVTISNVNSSIVIATTSTPANCTSPNGTATANPSGGVAPYTYSWNTNPVQTTQTANNLGSGTYTVTVTDNNNCTQTQTVTVNNQGNLSSTIASQNETCGKSNGSATVTPAGGNSPYTYSWSTNPVQTTQTAANLGAGTYTVIVTDVNGCTSSSTTVINNVTNIAASVIDTPATCTSSNGSATIITSAGTSPFTFQWSTNQNTQTATGLSSGTYSCIVTDSLGCSLTVTVTVNSVNQPLNAVLTSTPAVCSTNSGAASVNVNGGTSPYNYTWNTGAATQTISGLAQGIYTVNIVDQNGCDTTVSVTVGHINNSLNTILTSTPAVCSTNSGAASVNVNGGTSPYNYTWNTSATTQTISGLAQGIYTVNIVDLNGCDTAVSVTVGHINNSLQVSGTTHNETCSNSNGSIFLQISGGTQPYTYSWNTGAITQNLTHLPAGNYTVSVSDFNGCVAIDTLSIKNIISIGFTSSVNNDHCNKSSGSATVKPLNGTAPFSYQWSTGATTQTAGGLSAGNYTVTVTDSLGCATSGTVTINNVNDNFSGSVAGNNHLEQDESTTIYANLPSNWTILYWIGVNGDTIKSQTLTLNFPYPDYGNYTVTLYVVSGNGCISHLSYPIIVDPSWTFYVPNCVSPNDDGVNDVFMPKYTGIIELQGWVFDRWGQKVYTFSGLDDVWNGTVKGNTVEEDVYVYKFEFKDLTGKKHEKHGTISVIR